MDKKGKPSSTQLSSTLSPRWKSGSHNFKCTLSPIELADSQSKIATKKTELEHYKSRLGQQYKQSPIVKACRNIDEFYRSIRPLKSKFSTFRTMDQPFPQKPDLLVSFYSRNENEESEKLSQVLSREYLERFKEITNEYTVKQEDEIYQLTLKELCDRLSTVFYGKPINQHWVEHEMNREDSFSI